MPRLRWHSSRTVVYGVREGQHRTISRSESIYESVVLLLVPLVNHSTQFNQSSIPLINFSIPLNLHIYISLLLFLLVVRLDSQLNTTVLICLGSIISSRIKSHNMSTTTVTRLTPLMRNQLRANLQMTPLRPFHRSLSCQGHATSRFASTSASNFTSSAAARSLPLPTRAKGDWSKLIMRSVKQTLV